MKSRYYQLKEAWNKILLNEILGDFKPADLQLSDQSSDYLSYSANIDGDTYVFIIMRHFEKTNDWNMEFLITQKDGENVNDAYQMTGKMKVFTVMATVNEVIKRFLKWQSPITDEPIVLSYGGWMEKDEMKKFDELIQLKDDIIQKRYQASVQKDEEKVLEYEKDLNDILDQIKKMKSKRLLFYDRYIPRMFQKDPFYQDYEWKMEEKESNDVWYTDITFRKK
jgi:hypothetical protein